MANPAGGFEPPAQRVVPGETWLRLLMLLSCPSLIRNHVHPTHVCPGIVVGITFSDAPEGLFVFHVTANGPCEDAGIRQGDVVTSVDGNNVFTRADFGALAKTWAAGERHNFTVRREGESIVLPVIIGHPSQVVRACVLACIFVHVLCVCGEGRGCRVIAAFSKKNSTPLAI